MEDTEDRRLSIVEQVMAYWALEMRHISTTSSSSSSLSSSSSSSSHSSTVANYKANLRGKGTLSNLTSNNSNSALTVKKKNYKIYCLRERNHIHMAPFIAPNLLGIISFEQRGRMQKIIWKICSRDQCCKVSSCSRDQCCKISLRSRDKRHRLRHPQLGK